jgi:WD40 repeat protein
MLSGAGNGDDERALLQLVAAHRVAPGVEVDSGMREVLAHRWNLQRLVSLTHRLSCIAFSPDGSRIASGSRDRTSRLLQVISKPDELCKKLTHNMSREEWREWVSSEIDYIEQCPGLPIPPNESISIKNKL